MHVTSANLIAVITQVFPDEYHLHTLDQFLSSCARLHPNVNIKAIVIGMMDRLSAYAASEQQAETPEQRKRNEEEAIVRMANQIHISEPAKEPEPEPEPKQNGDAEHETDGEESVATTATAVDASILSSLPKSEADDTGKRKESLPDDLKLFEIFHEQVVSLVKLSRLPLWDTIALLVSLTNLAM